MNTPAGVKVVGAYHVGFDTILTHDALKFLAELHRKFNSTRMELMQAREHRQQRINVGEAIKFPTADHDANWKVNAIPNDLQQRHVEITGPAECKMVINALNSGSDVFMADFEDSLSPLWKNVIGGQLNLLNANQGTITFENPDGSVRKLKDKLATLVVRTRGWHLEEQHIYCDGQAMAGALVDFGLYYHHNREVRKKKGAGVYYYLPKMETHLECRLWNDIFEFTESYYSSGPDSISCTIMVETIMAAIEMEEMLYELRKYACGMNAGRWDYIFSAIKRLQNFPDAVLPDRKQVTMTVPFMKNYTDHLVKVCHRHGAHAMGGMSAFIPSRRDADVNRVAMEQVRADKEREVKDGFDGTWVAHPDLVGLAKEVFTNGLKGCQNQVHRQRDDVNVTENDILNCKIANGTITEGGIRLNISVGLQYLNWWLQGVGAVAINNLMEDAATAEISRGQLWQWLRHHICLDDGRKLDVSMYKKLAIEELEKLGGASKQKYGSAAELLDNLVLSPSMVEFLTLPAYGALVTPDSKLEN